MLKRALNFSLANFFLNIGSIMKQLLYIERNYCLLFLWTRIIFLSTILMGKYQLLHMTETELYCIISTEWKIFDRKKYIVFLYFNIAYSFLCFVKKIRQCSRIYERRALRDENIFEKISFSCNICNQRVIYHQQFNIRNFVFAQTFLKVQPCKLKNH